MDLSSLFTITSSKTNKENDENTYENNRPSRNYLVNPYTLLGFPDEITNLREFIQFAYYYQGDLIDSQKLKNIIPYLEELDDMIGMEKLKNSIVDTIMYFTQGLFDKNEDYLHSVIYGPPGTGKTHVGKILANIYSGLGILKTNKFHIIKRTDLVGKYLGHTAPKTKNKLESCLGGVVFIDEAYSLASNDNDRGGDSFSKEAIDVINEFLSEHKNDIVMIIAGYEEELNKTFFAVNPGLKRRFPWAYTIDKYTNEEMIHIFYTILHRMGWTMDKNTIDEDFFEENKDLFKHYGGDIETFLTKCKFSHIRRIYGKEKCKRHLNKKDIELALQKQKQHGKDKKEKSKVPFGIYT